MRSLLAGRRVPCRVRQQLLGEEKRPAAWPSVYFSWLALLLTCGPLVAGEPFGNHQRACVSGQKCTVSALTGTGLSDGDRLALLPECASGPATPGMPGTIGATDPATNGGQILTWADPITPDGGEYKMCWCGVASDCSTFAGYTAEVGVLTVTGPFSGLKETCTGGRTCVIDGIEGVYLRNNDSVQILNECGISPGVAGFPNDARTTTGFGGGTEHGWGGSRIRATGGTYQMCWCAKGAICIEGVHHRKQIGELTVIGPTGGFTKTCRAFSECTWDGLDGVGLQDGDRIMLLEECGAGKKVVGFPNNDIAVASNDGVTYEFPGSNNVIIAGGLEYEMCWCGRDVSVCASPANFLVKAGTLIVLGPGRDHDISCIQGTICQISDFKGVGLTDGDKIMVLLECGRGVAIGGFPDGGIGIASDAGTSYKTWTSPVNAQYGTYHLCWCGASWNCNSVASYKADAGLLRIVGMNPNQHRSCHVRDGCAVDNLRGHNLRDGDLMRIRTACGAVGANVPEWPEEGLSQPATLDGTSFSWGLVERVLAKPGTYKMCWCPLAHSSKCDEPSDFSIEVGDMQLRGPVEVSRNGSCSAYQMPACIVGPFNNGVGLTYGSDQILLVNTNQTCRDGIKDPIVGGDKMGIEVQSDALVYFAPSDLPFGGIWRMCYCASYDSRLDADSEACSSPKDFPVEAGRLFVMGAYPGQAFDCTRNEVCRFSILGYDMNKDIHHIAVRDDTVECGSDAEIDSATRRRRDITGNPYGAVERISDEEIVFVVDPIQTLMTFHICFCAPPPAGGQCEGQRLTSFDQWVGELDIRGAAADQEFVCGRGGHCDLKIAGRHLSEDDFVKIVNMTTECDGPAQVDGFFRSLVPAATAPLTTKDFATFNLGRVTASGSFKICYCASLSGCDADYKYNHLAGIVTIVDPLASLQLSEATAASITVDVESRITSDSSRIRCAVAEYEPRGMPTAADVTDGLGRFGLGKGESDSGTITGTNRIEIFFKSFVRGGQQYRVWCFDTSAQSFILPDHAGGILVITPEDIAVPRLVVFPGFLWSGARFYAELHEVFDRAIVRPSRRLQSTEEFTTNVRVATGSAPAICNRMAYEDAFDMSVSEAGKVGKSDAILVTNLMLEASQYRPYMCFFAGSKATAIAMSADKLVVQGDAPSFSQKRLTGEEMQKFYRGVLMQVIMFGMAPENGLLHWTPQAVYDQEGCTSASRAPPTAKVVSGTNTSFFRMEDPSGMYVMCYLGKQAESPTVAPFNGIGSFELIDSITAIGQDPKLPSTRNTIRLELEIRVPGDIICIARSTAADVVADDFDKDRAFQGRAELEVPPVDEGFDPEFPRRFQLSLPLFYYQRTIGPLHVWCHHKEAEQLVYPESRDGTRIVLQGAEPTASPMPTFIWNYTRFKLNLFNTPDIDTKLLALHEPKLPADWKYTVRSIGGLRTLVYYREGSTEYQEEHPVYAAWVKGEGDDPCKDSNLTNSIKIVDLENTQSEKFFQGASTSPFVCYWASKRGNHPHLIAVLDILTQPPEFKLEIGGQVTPFVFRGVDVNIRLQHTSPSGGRILVVRKDTFDSYGGACQDMGLTRRSRGLEADSEAGGNSKRRDRYLQSTNTSSQASGQCQQKARKTAQLKVVSTEDIFPEGFWGVDLEPGLNCSRDYKLYWNVAMMNTSVMADEERGHYFLVTANVSVLLHLVKIRLLTGTIPNSSVAVVHNSYSSLKNLTIADSWVLSAHDCATQGLLSMANPMREEGAESLTISEYEKAILRLEGFDFYTIIYMPDSETVLQRDYICEVLQPPPPTPKRPESVFDIDKPGLGRTVRFGMVYVPSFTNGSGTFLHNDALATYVMCYIGDETDENPIFNPIGMPFESHDVLPKFQLADTFQSTSQRAFLNITSRISGRVRCLVLLRNVEAPTEPEHVFKPDMKDGDYLGSSDVMQFNLPGSSLIMPLNLDQGQAKFITPSAAFAKAPPTMYIWCAHHRSTVLYPGDSTGFLLDVQARPPPRFVYKQLNKTITVIDLTLQLEFTPIISVFEDPDFPVNAYDEVSYSTRPKMPKGLEVDVATGAIYGIPAEAGEFARTVVASSKNPPGMSSYVNVLFRVGDVLGLKRSFVNVESVLFSISPRSTTIFQAQEVALLTQLKVKPFANTENEFFCLPHDPVLAEQGIPPKNTSKVYCQVQGEACCCIGYILRHLVVQDIRVTAEDCSNFQLTKKYHTRGMVKGLLTKAERDYQQAVLASGYTADFLMPEEMDSELKAPVKFDLVINMEYEEYTMAKDETAEKLIGELASVVAIPNRLVSIKETERTEDNAVRFTIFFQVEPRCLERVSTEISIFAFGIDTKEGCNRVAPEEYMKELMAQLQNEDSALFFRDDLPYLKRVNWKSSFSLQKVMYFCNREPVWEYGAVVEEKQQCPFDPLKLGMISLIFGTIGFSFMFGIVCYISHEFAACSFLHRGQFLDFMTPLLSLYTTLADYTWLVMLKTNAAHPLHDTIFLAALIHLFVCFCINTLTLRIIITSYIQDTPWWRRNRKRLKSVLFLSMFATRFFRITRSHLFGLDITQIHFGTPSKMSVTFSDLGMVMLFQDIPQLFLQGYIWLVWRNQSPKISLICILLGGLSIFQAILHHVFSRSQKAAYERVVKLLGVRRLTAGFFDVSAAATTGKEHQLATVRKAGGGSEEIELGEDEDENAGPLDPTKLDPIAAAMYVAAEYEKENKQTKKKKKDDESESESDESESASESGSEDEEESDEDGKTLYPKEIYDKLKKFYKEHDPSKIDSIGIGNVQVDEAKLDAELKKKFNVGLDSVS